MKAEDVMATLEKLGELKAKGILTQDEFDAKKTELLKKLVSGGRGRADVKRSASAPARCAPP
jgi:hypothetical protein